MNLGAELPIIRRSQSRSQQGKLKETSPDLSILGIDPIALRIGTIMPGLLPLIEVGSEFELGRAVSQLTGLSALVDLAEHVRRAKLKIDKDFVKAKTSELNQADQNYETAKSDLENILLAASNVTPTCEVPRPSDDATIEGTLDEITRHFESAKASAFESAKEILGEQFDPANLALLADLEKNISRALERASRPQDLPSAARLGALRQIASEQLDAAEARIETILAEAATLDALAKDASKAARLRLYARVATWIADHPDPHRDDEVCVICGSDLKEARDPITGLLVGAHLRDAAFNADLLSQTLTRWAENVHGELLRNSPEALRAEMVGTLPAHPCDLLRTAIIDELFDFEPFRGVLGELKAQTASKFDEVVKDRAPLAKATEILLPGECHTLGETLRRLDCAVRFARWRQGNDALARNIVLRVLGRLAGDGEPSEKTTLTGKLLSLDATAKAAKPISDALVQCKRLKQHLKTRRAAEARLREYSTASNALGNLANLGQLADKQVDHLRTILRNEAATWRSRIYLGAFPDTAHKLVDTGLGRKGELDLVVQTGGVSAPAQHVTNASALRRVWLRSSLRLGARIERARRTESPVARRPARTARRRKSRTRRCCTRSTRGSRRTTGCISYDPRFCSRASRLVIPGGIEHLEVNPATRQQPVIRTTPPLPVIQQRQIRFEADPNLEEPARDFADGCRVFFEAKLGDIFDGPSHFAWAIANPDPTLATFVQRLRPLVRSGPQGMFSAHVFRRFVDHPALFDGSPVLTLMNKAHHGRREEIRAADVAQCADDLNELLELAENMYEECYRWRRRDLYRSRPRLGRPHPL